MNIFFGQLMQLIYGEQYIKWIQQSLQAIGTNGELPAVFDDYLIWLSILVPIIYSAFFWTVFAALPAQLILNIRVVNSDDSGKLSIVRALLRSVVLLMMGLMIMILPMIGALLMPVILLMASRQAKRQSLHDLIARSVVVMVPRQSDHSTTKEPNNDQREF